MKSPRAGCQWLLVAKPTDIIGVYMGRCRLTTGYLPAGGLQGLHLGDLCAIWSHISIESASERQSWEVRVNKIFKSWWYLRERILHVEVNLQPRTVAGHLRGVRLPDGRVRTEAAPAAAVTARSSKPILPCHDMIHHVNSGGWSPQMICLWH